MLKEKPDFLCIGLPKAGTSTLHFVLDSHPDIAMPPVKEVKFLIKNKISFMSPRILSLMSNEWPSQQDRAYLYRFLKTAIAHGTGFYQWRSIARYYFLPASGKKWYQGLFHPNKISGDITVNYFWITAEEIKQLKMEYPWLKIIIMLRNPIELHWSYFRMLSLRKKEKGVFDNERFEREIEEKKQNIGRYADLVGNWKQEFQENVFVGIFDDLRDEPVQFFNEVCKFLGVEQSSGWTTKMRESMGVRVNQSPYLEIAPELAAPMLELSRLNLDEFETINAKQKKIWMSHLEKINSKIENHKELA